MELLRITADEYDKFYTDFRNRIEEIDDKLTKLQTAEDNYYLSTKYILELANKAYDLFMSSEIEERRQLLKFTLLNLTLDGKNIQFRAQKPFDTLLNFADGPSLLPLKDLFLNQETEFGFSLTNIQTVFQNFQIQPQFA